MRVYGPKRKQVYKQGGKGKLRKFKTQGKSMYPSIGAVKPLGNVKKVNHRYCQGARTINPGLGSVAAAHYFSVNGLYDPDITGVGHQPVGFDQMSPFFQKYTVIGATITVDFENINAGDTHMIVGIAVQDDAVFNGDIERVIENGNMIYTTIGSSDGGDNHRRLTYNVNPNTFLGIKNPMSDDRVKGTDSSNPTEQVYFAVFAGPNRSAVDADVVRILVTIDYTCVWHEPNNLAKS